MRPTTWVLLDKNERTRQLTVRDPAQKINAANSWNLALIDYFYDMNILRDGDSINFQKASCTLDGCVKIYTSRVDSVASETGKLLSGLADNAAGEDQHDGDAEGGNEGGAPRKRVGILSSRASSRRSLTPPSIADDEDR